MDDLETVVNQEEQQEEVEENQEEVIEESEESEEVQENEESEVPEEDETEEEQDLVVTIGDEETPPQDDENETQSFRDLRKAHKDAVKEKKKLQKELEEIKSSSDNTQELKLGDKPTLESCEYDEDLFEQKLDNWKDNKKIIEQQQEEEKELKQKQDQEWQNTLNSYDENKKALKVQAQDYDDAEEDIKNTLSENQQGIILHACDNPALVVLAVGRNEKVLKQLSEIKDPIKFAAEVARLETKLKTNVKARKAPKPETRVTGAGSSAKSDSTLKRLEKEAESSGDWSKVFAHKNKMKQG